jgi:hypothetical protein
MPSEVSFEIVILDPDDFQSEYKRAFEEVAYTANFTKEMHQAEFKQFHRVLREALSRYWEEDACGQKDFAIMDTGEWSGTWHHCGGIYSNRICCARYITTILEVIGTLPHAALWTYHTACELSMTEDEPLFDGDFFIRGGKMFVLPPLEDEDYDKIFRRIA